MKKKLAFSEEDRDSQIAIQQTLGFRLFEEQRHFDRNWLLFTDEPYSEPLPTRDLGKEIDDLKARLEKLEKRSQRS